jgi:molybdopterin molybdotransferase
MTARDDCFAASDDLMPIDEALGLLRSRVAPVAAAETVALPEALGRILAVDVVSDIDVPQHDNAAVDGYAVFFDDLNPAGETRLPVAGRIAAGHPLGRPAERGQALRIFTGAAMPAGPDTVAMQEDCRIEGDAVVIPSGLKRGRNRREAGEDVARGAVALRAGTRLRPQEIGLAAAIGRTGLEVRQPLRVAVFSTGDEIREPGAPLPPGGVYDSNRHTLRGLLALQGCAVTDLGILPDRRDAIRAALAEAAPAHDLLVTSGGVSVGEEDHVKAAVETQGRLHFWRLAIKPGRPVALGQVGRTPFIGLPGNPVAVMVVFMLLARPLIAGLSGRKDAETRRYSLPAAFSFAKKAGRHEYLRGRVAAGGVEKFAADGSGILSSMTWSDGLIELPPDCTQVNTGDPVSFIPFAEVLS